MDTNPTTEVTEEAPAEERLAALFADDEEATEDAPEEGNADTDEESESESTDETPAEVVEEDEEVEFEGKSYKLPKELKPALLRQADYTKKTQELAEHRKQVADQSDFLSAQRQLLSAASQTYADLRAAELELSKFQNIDWQGLANADPGRAIALSKQQENITRYVENSRTKLTEMGKHAEKTTTEHKAYQWQTAVESARKAIGKVPPEVDAKALQMVQEKFGSNELHRLADANVLQWVVEAAQWRLLQDSKPGLTKRAAEVRPVKQVSRSSPQAQVAGKAALARQTLKKTGNSNAAEAYFESIFSRRK